MSTSYWFTWGIAISIVPPHYFWGGPHVFFSFISQLGIPAKCFISCCSHGFCLTEHLFSLAVCWTSEQVIFNMNMGSNWNRTGSSSLVRGYNSYCRNYWMPKVYCIVEMFPYLGFREWLNWYVWNALFLWVNILWIFKLCTLTAALWWFFCFGMAGMSYWVEHYVCGGPHLLIAL